MFEMFEMSESSAKSAKYAMLTMMLTSACWWLRASLRTRTMLEQSLQKL